MECIRRLFRPRQQGALPTPAPRPAPLEWTPSPLLTVNVFEEALRALPGRIDLVTSVGVAFSNRGDAPPPPRDQQPTMEAPLSGGITMRYWGDAAEPPTTGATGRFNVGGPSAPASSLIDCASHVDLESFPIPAWVVGVANGALTTLRVNTRWASYIGVTPGEVSPQAWRNAVHPDDAVKVSQNWTRAISSGSEYTSDLRMRRGADGEYCWFRGCAHPLRNSKGAIVAFLGVTMDIGEAVRDKTHLAVEQALLESVLDQLPVGIFIRRAAGVSMFNRKIREIWGLTDATIQQFTSSVASAQYFSSHATHVDGSEVVAADMPSVRAFHGEVVSHEEMYYTPDGSNARLMSVSAAPVFGHDGDIVAAVAVIEDVTDARESEAERLRLMEEERLAKVSAKAQSDFLANMSHELRSPVHGILGLVELLALTIAEPQALVAPVTPRAITVAARPLTGTARADDPSNTVTQRQYCHAIRECAMLLQSLVSSVLDFSKIDAGLMSLESLPLNLVDIVDRSILLLHVPATERGVTLSREATADFPAVLVGDALRLQQIVINLTNNALKFCQDAAGGGKVIIRVSRAPPLWTRDGAAGREVDEFGLEDSFSPGAGSPPLLRKCPVVIEVEDNGPGVSPDVAARLFKPFTQADSSITRRFGGTGLGLSIVRGLAELMGGSARVVSPNAMGGATFSCCVVMGEPYSPAVPEPSSGGQCVPEHVSADAGTPDSLLGAKILVVDDIHVNRLIAQRFLLAHGATVDLAENGKAGFEAVSSADPPYDVVFMDCHMPVLDGYAASQAIRALPDASRASVPIIAISASALRSDVDKSLAAGMNAHVSKPIESTALVACVCRWIKR